MKNKILNPLTMLTAGLLLGLASRLFDIYFETLGNIFSQMAIWILFGASSSIYSKTRKDAIPLLQARIWRLATNAQEETVL